MYMKYEILQLSENTKTNMNILNQSYRLKGAIVGPPDLYLGTNNEKGTTGILIYCMVVHMCGIFKGINC